MQTVILDEKAMQRAVARISYEIIERNKGTENLCIIGMLTRGVDLAGRIAQKIFEVEGKQIEIGVLDISAHRDDRKIVTMKDDTVIGFDINDKIIVLVDDVIFTGRSVRAAIDTIMDIGRPKKIELAVLVDRGHRELPIRADFIGKNLPTSREEDVRVLVKKYDKKDEVLITKEDEA
ncbi:MAG: bifunctional pyr operon transcriptional regulator/uracil phosphoribosyltransferase PyrR [Oscillospiraceae bacterium]